jgi:hypothetical protein
MELHPITPCLSVTQVKVVAMQRNNFLPQSEPNLPGTARRNTIAGMTTPRCAALQSAVERSEETLRHVEERSRRAVAVRAPFGYRLGPQSLGTSLMFECADTRRNDQRPA